MRRILAVPVVLLVAVDGRLAADAPKEEPLSDRLEIHAFVDGVFTYNANRPADHANFFAGAGTSAKRDNEFSINLAQLALVLAPEPIGFKLALGYGTAMDVVHAAEPAGVAASPDIWHNVVQASFQYQTKVGRGLLLEAGVFPSHIGFEAFASKDNWNYTRSWLGELSPYYQTGVKAAYPFGERWSGQLHVLNGWQVISDNNRGKSLGLQLARAADKLSLTFNGIVGPELTDNDDDLRSLLDIVATYKATPRFSFAISGDAAQEERTGTDDVSWYGVGAYARYAPPESRTAVALRGEYYDDEDGAISGIGQTLKELTVTLEHRPVERLIVKLEGRYDRSTADAFAGNRVDVDGNAIRDKHEQVLVLIGVVATF